MKQWIKILLVCGVVISISACATKTETPPPQQDTTSTEPQAGIDDGSRGTIDEPQGFQGHELDNPDSPLSKRTVYFDFDSSEIKAEDRETITAHADYLARNPAARVTLEGHADERGSREYNIALGERRAKAVQQLMTLQGASASQIDTISYGEEKPIALGHDESAWSANRRVEIIYISR